MKLLRQLLALPLFCVVWIVAHSLAGLFYALGVVPFRVFAFVVLRVVSPCLRATARFFGYCAKACGCTPRERKSHPLFQHHSN